LNKNPDFSRYPQDNLKWKVFLSSSNGQTITFSENPDFQDLCKSIPFFSPLQSEILALYAFFRCFFVMTLMGRLKVEGRRLLGAKNA